ncbi:MAG TPA: hypothetical protein PKK43_02590 [Spirochaetota bacterium]|nr:hypothetical protein [Spirochaetota bacterium]
MRIAAIVLVIIGSLLSVGLGGKWLSDYNEYKDQITAISQVSDSTKDSKDSDVASASSMVIEQLKAIQKIRICGILLIIGGILSLVLVFLANKFQKIAGGALVVLGIVPGIVSPVAFVVTFFGIIAGILTFLMKPKAA